MQRLIVWAQFVTALAALATAILVGYQLKVYEKQLAEMQAQTVHVGAQTFVNEAATLAHVFPPSAATSPYREQLQKAQQFTFDVVAADALEPRPTPTTPLVNVGAVHEISRQAEERLVEQLFSAAQAFDAERAVHCGAYSSDALRNIQREFMATYLLVHPAAGGNLDAAWQLEKQKHGAGRQSSHTTTFRQFTTLVDRITAPCPVTP